jgi:heat shock protein HtpX
MEKMKNQERISFQDEITKNKILSVLLIFIVFFVLIGLIYVIGLAMGLDIFFILTIAIIFSLIYVWSGYFFSDKIAIASVGGKEASQSQFRQYHDLVEGLCLASGLPKPKLYIMNSPEINAFATGRSPEKAVICVTTGALEKLNKQELEGVLSHELSHIANYDIRFMTLVAVLVGMIAIISEIFLRSLWFKSSDDNGKGNAIFLLIGIALAILAPILVQLVQLAISRKREYAADSSAVKFTRTPTGLIGALKKIKGNHNMKVSGAVSPLFISSPKKLAVLFSTHPDINDRIERLSRM